MLVSGPSFLPIPLCRCHKITTRQKKSRRGHSIPETIALLAFDCPDFICSYVLAPTELIAHIIH